MTVRSNQAPMHVRTMLCEAIAFGNRQRAWWEWFSTDAIQQYPWAEQETRRWMELDAKGRARWFTSQLWNCGDVVPLEYLTILGMEPGMTYARVVSLLRLDLEAHPDTPTGNGQQSLRQQSHALPRYSRTAR